jgi:hypothetical protein
MWEIPFYIPGQVKDGVIFDIVTNPACIMRHLVVRWSDGTIEELEELEFGPLE